jgi:hypothetical protein
VQQLVVEQVESVESAALEQQQEHANMQVVKPVEQPEHVVSSSNGNGKPKPEKKDSSDTTSQGSPVKAVPQAETVRNLVFVTSEVGCKVASESLSRNCCPGSGPVVLVGGAYRVVCTGQNIQLLKQQQHVFKPVKIPPSLSCMPQSR